MALETPLTQLGEGNVGSLPPTALFAAVAAYLKRDILGGGGKVLVPWSLLLSTDLGPGFELMPGIGPPPLDVSRQHGGMRLGFLALADQGQCRCRMDTEPCLEWSRVGVGGSS